MNTSIATVTIPIWGSKPQIAFMNRSTVLTDAQVQAAIAPLQTQISRDFCPYWHTDADLHFVGVNQQADPNMWWVGVFDDSDTAGALGYHDLTPQGLPLGKIFAKTDLTYGSSWTVTASHELLEILGDPEINRTVFDQLDTAKGTLFAYENCDAVEDDSFGYMIDGVLVSDFVLPTWFINWQPSSKYDFQSKVSAAFGLLSGGYMSAFDIPNNGNGWVQVNAQSVPQHKMIAPRGSRRERRARGKQNWQRSSPTI